jgi:hypothetical protein
MSLNWDLTSPSGKSYRRGRLSTVDLLVITSLDELLVIMQTLFTFKKTRYLTVEANRTENSLAIGFPFPSVLVSASVKQIILI